MIRQSKRWLDQERLCIRRSGTIIAAPLDLMRTFRSAPYWFCAHLTALDRAQASQPPIEHAFGASHRYGAVRLALDEAQAAWLATGARATGQVFRAGPRDIGSFTREAALLDRSGCYRRRDEMLAFHVVHETRAHQRGVQWVDKQVSRSRRSWRRLKENAAGFGLRLVCRRSEA